MRSELFADIHQEKNNTERWTLQSKRMLRTYITPDAPMVATKGSMVAYQGNVTFRHKGSRSVGEFFKKQLTSEDTPMMSVEGHGEVFYARNAANIFLMQLEGDQDALTVNSSRLLAFDAHLNWDIKRIRGGMGALASGSGLFNIEMSGQGSASVCCYGDPMILDCSQTPTYVDPQAAVCWSANLAPQIKVDASVGTFIGRESGETIQLMFHGPGFVVVQPAETY